MVCFVLDKGASLSARGAGFDDVLSASAEPAPGGPEGSDAPAVALGASPAPPGPPAASYFSNCATALKNEGNARVRSARFAFSSAAAFPEAKTTHSGSSPTFSSAM